MDCMEIPPETCIEFVRLSFYGNIQMNEVKNRSGEAKALAHISRSEKIWVAAIGAFSGMVGAALTYSIVAWFEFQNRDRELDLELANIALAIMAGKHDPEAGTSYPSRRFAVDALEKGTGVAISNDLKEQWARSGEVNFGAVPASLNGKLRSGADLQALARDIRKRTCRIVAISRGAKIDDAERFCADDSLMEGNFLREIPIEDMN